MLAHGPAGHVDVFLGTGTGVIHIPQMNGEIGLGQLHLLGHRHRRGMAVERPGAPVAGNGQGHVAVHTHQRRVGGERRVMPQVLDPLEQRLAPQQIQQFPFATTEQAAVLEHSGLQFVYRLRQGAGVTNVQDRQAVGQLPRHTRLIVRQVAALEYVLRLIVTPLQQRDDGLEFLRSSSLTSFFQAISRRVNKPCRCSLTLSYSCSQ